MSVLPDATHAAALNAEYIRPVWFAWLDFVGDPVRANTSGANITPTGTGDPDLDGLPFIGITADLVSVTPVRIKEGGSDTVVAELSGIQGLDATDLALLNNPSNWRGRDARLWRIIRNAANIQQGGFHSYYTGKMVALTHSGSGEGQTLRVTIESYLAVFASASNRTYLNQEEYDPGDLSARASIAIANGNYGGATVASRPGGGGSGGGGGNPPSFRQVSF
ncbi:gene transfer agent protein [Synechococcus phage Yong-M3-232]|nr:gene transfer agent protein [Synechococcus phage Yong-M3-232]